MQFTTLLLPRQVRLAGCLNFTIKQLEMHFVITELVLMKSYSHYYRGHHCNLVAPLTTAFIYQRDNFIVDQTPISIGRRIQRLLA